MKYWWNGSDGKTEVMGGGGGSLRRFAHHKSNTDWTGFRNPDLIGERPESNRLSKNRRKRESTSLCSVLQYPKEHCFVSSSL